MDPSFERSDPPPPSRAVPVVVIAGVALLLLVGGLMVRRAEAKTNKVSLASRPEPVGVVRAAQSTYRASRTYGGTFQSWLAADVGPERVSAYVDTVLVRPGARVKRGEVMATLDCRAAGAVTHAIAMRARALASRQKAVASEAGRVQTLLKGNFVSPNDAEEVAARAAEEEARLEGEKAKLAAMTVTVDDCVLRAPFDGEVAERFVDPGAFARPGHAIASVIDRSTVRLAADAPETDYDIVAPGTRVRVLVYATGEEALGTIARRTPVTDLETRTVRFEVDVPAGGRTIPSNTTGEVFIDVGDPVPATEIPLFAASVRDKTASLFVVEAGIVHERTVAVRGEIGGSLFVDPALAAGTLVVSAGRALLADGDRVLVKERPR